MVLERKLDSRTVNCSTLLGTLESKGVLSFMIPQTSSFFKRTMQNSLRIVNMVEVVDLGVLSLKSNMLLFLRLQLKMIKLRMIHGSLIQVTFLKFHFFINPNSFILLIFTKKNISKRNKIEKILKISSFKKWWIDMTCTLVSLLFYLIEKKPCEKM